MNKTVFISSTFRDLQPHRKAVWDLLAELDVSIRGMEQFGARTESALDTCILEVEQSDIYVGIIGFRLGSVDKDTDKSFTQIEYERAIALKREVLIYLIDEDNSRVYAKDIDRDTNWNKLESFKRKLREQHTVDSFLSEDDLVRKLRRDLGRFLEPRAAMQSAHDDTLSDASVFENFFLTPKLLAGREVCAEVRIEGQPFAASRELCSAFNFEFGATIGVPVKIVSPQGLADSGLDALYLGPMLIGAFLPVKQGEQHVIYAKLRFADEQIESRRARFKRETATEWASMPSFFPQETHFKTVVYKPDTTVILELSKAKGS